ncbi:DUF4345 domain-containing protein [Pendulispora rubella]|uniref:DUF4345 domain-containing protein n=1 Tax=Pendulispora rubella TaxID=2741070 RepID=A0ABZ2KWU9_9BACT
MDSARLALVAAFFLGMGIFGLAAPTRLVAPFRIELDGAEARTEVRAVYGGFGIAIGALLLVAIMRTDLRRGAVVAVAFALLGMAFGRLVARLFERPSAFYPTWFYFWVELAGAGLLLASA